VTPGEANIKVQKGLLHDVELKDYKLFNEDYSLTKSFKCQQCRYNTTTCKCRRNCGFCSIEDNSKSFLTHQIPQATLTEA
jgi:biotin synthase-like enzyme